MAMAKLQLYKNPYTYPDYGSISSYGSEMDCTPVGTGIKSGSIRVTGNIADFMECNYLRLQLGGRTIYAWIEDAVTLNDEVVTIDYRVDAWRTYRGAVTLGTQFVARQPQNTFIKDDMLGSTKAYPDISTKRIPKTPNTNGRIFVVQVRGTGLTFSNTPVQPSPYQFYLASYQLNNWTNTTAIVELMETLADNAETENIVTMYSIPYMDISDIPQASLPVRLPGGDTVDVPGWRLINNQVTVSSNLTRHIPISIDENVNSLMRVDHSVKLVVPEAGIIDIPDELLQDSNLQLREDIDLFSGASNYMLTTGGNEYYTSSVRGSGVSSIPIISDPYDTYVSQNQNALATSLIGDVASIGVGTALTAGSGGLMAGAGVGAIATGLNGISSRYASAQDAGSRYNNPPAFLGTALAKSFNNWIWLVVTKQPVDNLSAVHNNYGYPINKVRTLNFPSSGYVKTEGCNVSSDGTVPRWAIEEINQMFNNGIRVH